MPRGQGTGPMGMGAMTGRAAGFCAGSSMPGYAIQGQKRGPGGCRREQRRRCSVTNGQGRGRTRGNVAPYQFLGQARGEYNLRDKADALQAELNHLRMRLEEIEP
ncbi:MAG: DUF5320 domain-containing protein [Proteobacteria bacterium]|nr:DUF5320 domain-containing protein [Pseudomonadota bacterium]MBU4294513.1 DUF5320 domain-containing protein [Pseudomonadota bacterium]MCG2747049.1 DUF5320 domain-containing protein [Desulfobulbaceae bacterium]